jgi:hypothetical protein
VCFKVFSTAFIRAGAFFEIGVERSSMPPNKVAVTVARPNLPYSTASIHRGHPAAADEGFVRFGLVLGGTLHRGVVQPDVGDVKAGEDAVGRGFPGDAEQHGLASEGFFPFRRPGAFGDEFLDAEAFASAPDAGGGIEGQLFLGLWRRRLASVRGGDDHAFVVFDLHFLELPDQPFALTVAGLVFEQEDVVLGGGDAGATVVVRVLLLAIDRQHRHGGSLRVRREESADMQHGAERDVPQVRRCAVITHDAVGQHGEGMRVVAEKHARSLHADAATAVRMIHEDEFATVGVRFFQWRELARLRGGRASLPAIFGGGEQLGDEAQLVIIAKRFYRCWNEEPRNEEQRTVS